MTVTVYLPPVTATIQFTNGVAGFVDVSSLLPVGADRYTGGFHLLDFIENQLAGIGFDPVLKHITYNGSAPYSWSLNPNPTNYSVGAEVGPYNPHWQYPPTTLTIPYPRPPGFLPVGFDALYLRR